MTKLKAEKLSIKLNKKKIPKFKWYNLPFQIRIIRQDLI
jgi:hypothetical protein